ncbi:MAG: hypothetical protein R3B52_02740 [Candidatus Paceibacterota bacterium]
MKKLLLLIVIVAVGFLIATMFMGEKKEEIVFEEENVIVPEYTLTLPEGFTLDKKSETNLVIDGFALSESGEVTDTEFQYTLGIINKQDYTITEWINENAEKIGFKEAPLLSTEEAEAAMQSCAPESDCAVSMCKSVLLSDTSQIYNCGEKETRYFMVARLGENAVIVFNSFGTKPPMTAEQLMEMISFSQAEAPSEADF